jgi:hypothetical protein
MNRILRVIFEADMRGGHRALSSLAKDLKIYVDKLNDGEHVVFINRRLDRIKVYSSRNVLSYHLSHTKLDLTALSYFSQCYGAKGFSYDEALKKSLQKRLGIHERTSSNRGAYEAET